MASYSRRLLSGTPSSGQVIPVVQTATPGTTVHTATLGDGSFDEVYLWATNVSGATAKLTIEWGGVADPGNHLVKQLSLPAHSAPIPVAVGQVLNGGLNITAFSDVASAINLSGFVNRIQ